MEPTGDEGDTNSNGKKEKIHLRNGKQQNETKRKIAKMTFTLATGNRQHYNYRETNWWYQDAWHAIEYTKKILSNKLGWYLRKIEPKTEGTLEPFSCSAFHFEIMMKSSVISVFFFWNYNTIW